MLHERLSGTRYNNTNYIKIITNPLAAGPTLPPASNGTANSGDDIASKDDKEDHFILILSLSGISFAVLLLVSWFCVYYFYNKEEKKELALDPADIMEAADVLVLRNKAIPWQWWGKSSLHGLTSSHNKPEHDNTENIS
jgi:hypothetical protein